MRIVTWLALAAILAIVYSLILINYGVTHPWWWLSLSFLCLISIVLARFYSKQDSPASRAEAIIAGTVSRFLASMVLLVTVYLLRKGGIPGVFHPLYRSMVFVYFG